MIGIEGDGAARGDVERDGHAREVQAQREPASLIFRLFRLLRLGFGGFGGGGIGGGI